MLCSAYCLLLQFSSIWFWFPQHFDEIEEFYTNAIGSIFLFPLFSNLILLDLSQQNLNSSQYFFLIQGIFYWLRSYHIISEISEVTHSAKDGAEEIEEFFTDCKMIHENLSDQHRFRIKSFCKVLKQDTTLCPHKLFEINNTAFMSFIATCLTYIVIAIQFKTVELPLKA